MKKILHGAQRAGPYLLVELLLPGGSLVALLIFVFRNNELAAKLGAQLLAALALAILAAPVL